MYDRSSLGVRVVATGVVEAAAGIVVAAGRMTVVLVGLALAWRPPTPHALRRP